MWLPITIISMLLYAVSELIGKKAVSAEKENSILKLRINAIIVDAVLLFILCIFYYPGTGKKPWLIAIENPLIILSGTLNILDVLFYLSALKYIGLTIQNAYYGATSIFLFIGMVFINLVYGKISDVRSMLVPGKLIIIVILLVSSFILPGLEGSVKNESSIISKLNKKNIILGLVFTSVGYVFDTVEALILTYSFAESDISSIDFLSAGIVVALFWGLLFYAILFFKTKKAFNPLKKENTIYILYGVINTSFIVINLYGVSLAPVQSNIFWVAYPIIPIIGSAIFLKERYSTKQYICIVVIAMSSMVFGLMDYIK